ncbi:MAG: AI-2E family transporter [Candidatus Saccharimonadales bacterium]
MKSTPQPSIDFKKVTAPQQRALAIMTIVAVVFAAYFLRHYFIMAVVAAIVGFLFFPVYRRLCKRMSSGGAAATTMLVSFAAVLIPVGLLLLMTVLQITNLAKDASSMFAGVDISALGNKVIDFINGILNAIPFVNYQVTEQSLTTNITELVQKFGSALLASLTSSLSSVFSFIADIIIYMYVFMSLLVNHEKIIAMFRKLNPLGEQVADVYIAKIAAMVKGTVSGQFIIAVCQGFADAALIYIGGIHDLFFTLFLILTALSVIPLGGGILAIPIGIGMILFGNIVGGLIVILGHILIVTNIDNVLRPRLVPPAAKLDSALMIVSVFSGIAMFGFLGIVIGPVLMILIVTTIRMYLTIYKGDAYETAKRNKDKSGRFGRLKHVWAKLTPSKTD